MPRRRFDPNVDVVSKVEHKPSVLDNPEVNQAYQEIEDDIIKLIKITKDDPHNLEISMQYRNHLCIILSLWEKMGEVIQGNATTRDLVESLEHIDAEL